KEFELKNEAWQASRLRLTELCPKAPTTLEEYQRGQAAIKAGAPDPFHGCNLRIVKATNAPLTNDWQWFCAPPYQTMVAIHEEELRKRVTPKPYEEYMLGLGRFLAKGEEAGTISPKGLVDDFNAGRDYGAGALKTR